MTTTEPEHDLGEHEGRPIARVALDVSNTGNGLSKTMEIDPAIFHVGDEVYVTFRCSVESIAYPRILRKVEGEEEDTGTSERTQKLKAHTAVILEDDVIADAIAAQEDRIRIHEEAIAIEKEREKGIERLDLDGSDADPDDLEALDTEETGQAASSDDGAGEGDDGPGVPWMIRKGDGESATWLSAAGNWVMRQTNAATFATAEEAQAARDALGAAGEGGLVVAEAVTTISGEGPTVPSAADAALPE